MEKKSQNSQRRSDEEKQECLVCGYDVGVVAGSKGAICRNCGYKDPCCE